MSFIHLSQNQIGVGVSLESGAIVYANYRETPFLRPYDGVNEKEFNPLKSSSFPFVPFGNRVEGNAFVFHDREISLRANTNWDPLYLHGDGWLDTWDVETSTSSEVTIDMRHRACVGEPYSYDAKQKIEVYDNRVEFRLSVTNTGRETMPFGLGHHFFFPMTSRMTLEATAGKLWTEKHGFLPDKRIEIPAHLDFRRANRLPSQWINNGYDGWDGRARIVWPERNAGVEIKADESFRHYFIFRSDIDFEPDFKQDYFCFEPMTHAANAHNMTDYDNLVSLVHGETLHSSVSLYPYLA